MAMQDSTVHLHLVDQDPVGDPMRADHVWNTDYTAYRVVPLLWWDDASYIAYQADYAGADEEDLVRDLPVPAALVEVSEDDLPF